MKTWIVKTLKPLLGNFGRDKLPKIYKIYETLYWRIVIKRRKKGLQSKGYEYLPKVEHVLRAKGIQCFLIYGTLLGIVREGKFIGHDDDIDLGIVENDDFSWNKVQEALSEIGMQKKHQFSLDGKITEQTYRKKNLSIDFFLVEAHGDKSYSHGYFRREDEQYESLDQFSVRRRIISRIDGTTEYICESGKFQVPQNYELFLREVYGENWRVPDPSWVTDAAYLENKYGYQEKF